MHEQRFSRVPNRRLFQLWKGTLELSHQRHLHRSAALTGCGLERDFPTRQQPPSCSCRERNAAAPGVPDGLADPWHLRCKLSRTSGWRDAGPLLLTTLLPEKTACVAPRSVVYGLRLRRAEDRDQEWKCPHLLPRDTHLVFLSPKLSFHHTSAKLNCGISPSQVALSKKTNNVGEKLGAPLN